MITSQVKWRDCILEQNLGAKKLKKKQTGNHKGTNLETGKSSSNEKKGECTIPIMLHQKPQDFLNVAGYDCGVLWCFQYR